MLLDLRRDVAVLATRERASRLRKTRAVGRLRRARANFLANPVNLLLPYTAGALGGALALHRTPGRTRRGRPRDAVAWSSMLRTATTLWGLSLPLREALLDVRAAAIDERAENVVEEAATPRRRGPAPYATRPPTPPA